MVRRGPAAAVAASIVLHVAVGYAIARVSWSIVEDERRVLRVVWINERRPLPVVMIEEAPAPVAPAAPRVAEAPASTEAPTRADAPPASEAESATRGRGAVLPRGIDWERERRDAVAKVLEDRAREDGYITFSTDELFEDPPAAAPNPREKMFDSPGRGRSRSALTPGQARSRFGNRVAELCNALTGGLGISLFGFGGGTVCADPGPDVDFFADIRPAYMNSLPVCVETRDPLTTPEQDNEFPTIKCRLVEKDELE